MAQPAIQASFNSGEWSPSLNARVDLTKYHSAAARLRNFFVDYRGGASTRPGTKYVLQAYKSDHDVQLIPFQASFSVGYVLEFGDGYIRFFYQGAPVRETGVAISGATKANPCVLTIVGNNYNIDDWIYVDGVVGMTQLNGKYYQVSAVSGASVTLADLNGAAINSSAYSTYTSGGTAERVYTLISPYNGEDVSGLKWAQNVNTLILCHPDYNPYILTLNTATDWSILPIVIGATISAPTQVTVTCTTSLNDGSANYAYVVTSVDANGQESTASIRGSLLNKKDIRTVNGSIRISWPAVSGAVSYNVYKAIVSVGLAVPTGVAFGFIGNTTGTMFVDSNIQADYAQTPSISNNPFLGAGIATLTVTVPGQFTQRPTMTIDPPDTGGINAVAQATLAARTVSLAAPGGAGFAVGDVIGIGYGIKVVVQTVSVGFGEVQAIRPLTYPGSARGTFTALNPPASITTQGITFNVTWQLGTPILSDPGAGYSTVPNITLDPAGGGAAVVATLAEASAGNPTAPGFFQQRLCLAGQVESPQALHFSQPGAPYNFNISFPTQENDSISQTLVSGQLNSIKSMIPQTAGLLVLTDNASWLVNGGSPGAPIAPNAIVANPQTFSGASDLPPIVAGYDVLYVQAKGSTVRNSTFNFYANVFTGADISVQSSHLFYGYRITRWAWAEEPFKTVWAVRDDGVLLSLTFLKEQEFIAWAHSDTEGEFSSVATVTEVLETQSLNATYVVVNRTINGFDVKYIERFAERIFPNGMEDAWCVDAGLQYDGVPATSFSGGEHLAGAQVVGLADGIPITPFTMPDDGNFTLPTAASKVTIGLAFLPQLQTMALDLGEPTIQGKMKKITGVTARVQNTLGLTIGSDFDNQVPMKDLVLGNVGTATNEVVTDLVTGDAFTRIDPKWTVPGQYCFEQPNPLPATILGVIPQVAVGDTPK